jgi:DNA-binding LacI/PurR family transcriptional regulator
LKKLKPSLEMSLRLKLALTLPPVKAGMRLRPERELADRLGVGNKCIHRALQILTTERILSKRHGSGNYVRKIPLGLFPVETGEKIALEEIFPASELEAAEITRLASLPEQQQLHIQLWSGFHRPGNDNYSTFLKIQEQITLNGHCLVPREIVDADWQRRSLKDIIDELINCPADGYLVTSPLGELFAEAYRAAFHKEPDNVIYISSWGYEISLEPMIRQDGQEAMVRAIMKLHSCGFRKIAFLGLDHQYHPAHIDRHVYDFAMNICQLAYRCSNHTPYSTEKACKAMTAILEDEDPPEAVLIGTDKLLSGVVKALQSKKMVPGVDIAAIVINNSPQISDTATGWTSINFSKGLVGSLAANELLKLLSVAGADVRSISLLGKWRLEKTHNAVK